MEGAVEVELNTYRVEELEVRAGMEELLPHLKVRQEAVVVLGVEEEMLQTQLGVQGGVGLHIILCYTE
jgi:hypothetical protein